MLCTRLRQRRHAVPILQRPHSRTRWPSVSEDGRHSGHERDPGLHRRRGGGRRLVGVERMHRNRLRRGRYRRREAATTRRRRAAAAAAPAHRRGLARGPTRWMALGRLARGASGAFAAGRPAIEPERAVTCTPPACGGAACNESSRPSSEETRNCPSPAWTIGAWGSWSTCSATECGVAGHQVRTRTVTCPCASGNCPTPKPAERETQSCAGACSGCAEQTLSWGSGCSDTASAASSGATASLTNEASCRSGAATFTCNDGSWGSAGSGTTCTVTPATNGRCNDAVVNGCAAGVLQDVADVNSVPVWNCLGVCEGTDARCVRFAQLSVSISGSTGSGRGTATATVTGGTPPYAYSWNVLGGEIVGSSTGATISFTYHTGSVAGLWRQHCRRGLRWREWEWQKLFAYAGRRRTTVTLLAGFHRPSERLGKVKEMTDGRGARPAAVGEPRHGGISDGCANEPRASLA